MELWKVVTALVVVLAIFMVFRSHFYEVTGRYVGLEVQFNSVVGCDSDVVPLRIPIEASGNRILGEVNDVSEAIIKCRSEKAITVCCLRNGTLYEGKPEEGDYVIVKVDAKKLASQYGFNEYYICLESNLAGGKEIGKKLLSFSQDNLVCSVKLTDGNYFGIINGYYKGGEIGEVYIFEDPC